MSFCLGPEDAIYLVGRVPATEVNDDELDRITGSSIHYVDEHFPTAMTSAIRGSTGADLVEAEPLATGSPRDGGGEAPRRGWWTDRRALIAGLLASSWAAPASSQSLNRPRATEGALRATPRTAGVGTAGVRLDHPDGGAALAVKPTSRSRCAPPWRTPSATGVVGSRGVSTERLEAALPPETAVVRAMPNMGSWWGGRVGYLRRSARPPGRPGLGRGRAPGRRDGGEAAETVAPHGDRPFGVGSGLPVPGAEALIEAGVLGGFPARTAASWSSARWWGFEALGRDGRASRGATGGDHVARWHHGGRAAGARGAGRAVRLLGGGGGGHRTVETARSLATPSPGWRSVAGRFGEGESWTKGMTTAMRYGC